MRSPSRFVPLGLALTVALAFSPRARADARDDRIQALLDRVDALEHRVKELEAERSSSQVSDFSRSPTFAAPVSSAVATAVTPSPSGAPPPAATRVAATPYADSLKSLRIRGLLQLDSRWFFNNEVPNNDAFVIRRARFYLEGQLNRLVDFTLAPDFSGSAFTLLDANLNFAFDKAFQLRVGRFKPPVGLEYVQSDSWAFMVERSLVTNFVPFRDLGVLASGELLEGRVNYSVGVMNGVGDGANAANTGDYDNEKDVQGRVFIFPFRLQKGSPLSGLGFGIGGTFGKQSTASALTAGYRTDGQQTFFRYRAATPGGIVQDGDVWRLSPQADYYFGPVGAMAEYMISTVNVRPASNAAKLEVQNRAWQVSGSYVLTGDDASFTGVVPRHPFNSADGSWGALELTARVSGLDVDDSAFPLLADPTVSASAASSWGLGLNWYPSKSIRASINYFHTAFDLASPVPTNPVIERDENALLTRLQLNF